MSEAQLQHVLRFFKSLADASRLRLLGILAGGERSVDELAVLLDLRPPTVSHHLALLRELGLVAMRAEGNVHFYRLDEDALRTLSREVLSLERVASFADSIEAEAWERKVLRDFFDGERLKDIPASRKKRTVILNRLAHEFRPGARYRETEVNEVLKRHHPDPATLRRELVGAGLLERSQSVYWRPEGDTPAPQGTHRE
jgi:predicted transcriptional regulator